MNNWGPIRQSTTALNCPHPICSTVIQYEPLSPGWCSQANPSQWCPICSSMNHRVLLEVKLFFSLVFQHHSFVCICPTLYNQVRCEPIWTFLCPFFSWYIYILIQSSQLWTSMDLCVYFSLFVYVQPYPIRFTVNLYAHSVSIPLLILVRAECVRQRLRSGH